MASEPTRNKVTYTQCRIRSADYVKSVSKVVAKILNIYLATIIVVIPLENTFGELWVLGNTIIQFITNNKGIKV